MIMNSAVGSKPTAYPTSSTPNFYGMKDNLQITIAMPTIIGIVFWGYLSRGGHYIYFIDQ
jgi:hypothetical protein